MSAPAKTLIQIQPGEKFESLYVAVSDFVVVPMRNGGYFMNLRIRDQSGPRGARVFNVDGNTKEKLEGIEWAYISGHVDNTDRYRGEFKIDTLEPAAAPSDPQAFNVPLPGQHKYHKARFKETMASVKHPQLQALLGAIFSGETWDKFCEAPAAKANHHAYRGGLLEHSGEVALLCDRVTSVLPHLDRDLLVCAALLHDIGKIEEMEFSAETGSTTYTSAGELVGHVVLGTCTISCAADALPDFPNSLKHALMHLILSHHGEPEWGAARRPMCVEAVVLSLCDMMSARSATTRELLEKGGEGDFMRYQNFHSAPVGGQHSVYVGLMRALLPSGNET